MLHQYIHFWARAPISLLFLNLFSFLLLSIQCSSKFTTLLYHCSMLLEGLYIFMSFLLIISFILLLNSSTRGFSSYLLSLATLLNFYMNSSIVQFPCSIFFNSTTFIVLSSPCPNSFFRFAKNSSTVTYSNTPISKFFNIFPFQISADSLYTCNSTHWICSSVKIADDELYFIFPFYFILFYFSFIFLFNFLFLEQLGLGIISHAVTSVTNWWQSHKTDHRTWKKEIEDSGTKWCHIAWTIHASLMLYSWLFRVGCTVASMDYGQ